MLFALPMAAQDTLSSALDTTKVEQASLPVIEYTMQRKTYEIAGIEVTGAESYEDFVLIGFSGLAVGDKLEVPGDQITKSLKRFWKQGLFSDVKIKATKIEGDKIWLEIALKQRPRISDIAYNGLRKSEVEDIEVKVGIQKGGQIFQGNTTDVKELLEAQKHPEDYPNLIVRVGGFSARFVMLNPNVQNEIITRIRHSH